MRFLDLRRRAKIAVSYRPRARTIGRALSHRNYRLFFAGQSVSLIGTWMTRTATSWLVYRLTGSAFLLGAVGFASQIPAFILGPVSGVWVDRWNRHRVLVVTQALAMIQSGLLALFALRGTITVADVLVLSVFQGVINAFDMPARQAFLVEMIEDRDDLPNAIALNSSMVNVARLLGPSTAGIVIAAFGEGMCFLLDSVSYLAVIASLLALHVGMRVPAPRSRSIGAEVVEGFTYVARFAPMRALLLLLALVSVMGMPQTVLMPVIAGTVLHGGAYTLGFLMASSGLGALLGALYLASRSTIIGLVRMIPVTAAAFGCAVMIVAVSRSVPLSLIAMFLSGMAMMINMAATNTVLQTIVDEDKRGRVMSFYTMAVFGTAPFGSLAGGMAAEYVGAPLTLLLGGLFCIAGAALFARSLPHLRALVRPIYMRLGILPSLSDPPLTTIHRDD